MRAPTMGRADSEPQPMEQGELSEPLAQARSQAARCQLSHPYREAAREALMGTEKTSGKKQPNAV